MSNETQATANNNATTIDNIIESLTNFLYDNKTKHGAVIFKHNGEYRDYMDDDDDMRYFAVIKVLFYKIQRNSSSKNPIPGLSDFVAGKNGERLILEIIQQRNNKLCDAINEYLGTDMEPQTMINKARLFCKHRRSQRNNPSNEKEYLDKLFAKADSIIKQHKSKSADSDNCKIDIIITEDTEVINDIKKYIEASQEEDNQKLDNILGYMLIKYWDKIDSLKRRQEGQKRQEGQEEQTTTRHNLFTQMISDHDAQEIKKIQVFINSLMTNNKFKPNFKEDLINQIRNKVTAVKLYYRPQKSQNLDKLNKATEYHEKLIEQYNTLVSYTKTKKYKNETLLTENQKNQTQPNNQSYFLNHNKPAQQQDANNNNQPKKGLEVLCWAADVVESGNKEKETNLSDQQQYTNPYCQQKHNNPFYNNNNVVYDELKDTVTPKDNSYYSNANLDKQKKRKLDEEGEFGGVEMVKDKEDKHRVSNRLIAQGPVLYTEQDSHKITRYNNPNYYSQNNAVNTATAKQTTTHRRKATKPQKITNDGDVGYLKGAGMGCYQSSY